MATLVLASLASGGVQAAVSSTHTSENKIDFTAEGWHLSAEMWLLAHQKRIQNIRLLLHGN